MFNASHFMYTDPLRGKYYPEGKTSSVTCLTHKRQT